jgi:hypothetical protein
VLADLRRRRDAPEWAWLRADVETALREAQREQAAFVARREAREREEAQRALRAKVAAERSVLEETRAALPPGIVRLDFERARAWFVEQTAAIETEEVRADRDAARQLLDQLVRLKRFLALEISPEEPYTRAREELRGHVVRAHAGGIMVALPGGVGEIARGWDRVPPAVFADMVTFYLPRSDLPERDRGLLAAGLAVFFEMNEARPAAVAAARNAVRWNEDAGDALRRFLPGVMQDLD